MKLLLLVMLLTVSNVNAAEVSGFYQTLTFDDGSTINEAVEFTNRLTATPKKRSTQDIEVPKPKLKVVEKVGRKQECEMIATSVGGTDKSFKKNDMLFSSERVAKRYEVLFNAWLYISGNDDMLKLLLDKYGYKGYYAKYAKIHDWWRSVLSDDYADYHREARAMLERDKFLQEWLIDEILREALFEHNVMSDYEQALYKRDRCLQMAENKGHDIVGQRVKEIAQMIEEQWKIYKRCTKG